MKTLTKQEVKENQKIFESINSVLNFKPVAVIYKTMDYHIFGQLVGNRIINPTNLNKIKESLKERNIETNAIICVIDKNNPSQPFVIIDGQHRFEALKKLNEPIPFVVDYTIDIQDALAMTVLLNTSGKKWDLNNFMLSYDQLQYPDYTLYKTLKKSNNYEHEILFYIINDNPNRTTPCVNFDVFKEGKMKFDVNDYEYVQSKLNELDDIMSVIKTKNDKGEIYLKNPKKQTRYQAKTFINVLNKPNFDIEHCKRRLVNTPLPKCDNDKDVLFALSEIYNTSRSVGKRMSIQSQGKKVVNVSFN